MPRVAYFHPETVKHEKKRTEIGISLNDTRIYKYIQLKEKKNRWYAWDEQTICPGNTDDSSQIYGCDAKDI